MDAAALLPLQHQQTSRNPCKISGVFHRLAKACKLAAPTSFITPSAVAHGSTTTDETEGSSEDAAYHTKIHPQPHSATSSSSDKEESRPSCSTTSGGIDSDLGRVVLTQLMDVVSSIKLAYLDFQQAHVRYDADKLRSADEALVRQLETVSDIQLFYNEKKKKPKPANSKPTAAPPSCKVDVAEYQSLLDKLHAQIRAKDAQALQLRWALEEQRERIAEMEDEIIRTRTPEEEFQHFFTSSCRQSTPTGSGTTTTCRSDLLNLVHHHAARSIHEFGKPLIGLMKACGWDLDLAAEAAMARMRLSAAGVGFRQRSDKKYVFEAYLARILFTASPETEAQPGVNQDEEIVGRVMRFGDPLDTLAADPKSPLARFCSTKYLLAVHPAMERSFFGNLDQRAFVLRGGHPRTPFYRTFARMARWAWLLEALLTMAPGGASMFWVDSGRRFAEEHMHSVCASAEHDHDGPPPNSVVGFAVVPGFRCKEDGEPVVFPCKVYVSH